MLGKRSYGNVNMTVVVVIRTLQVYDRSNDDVFKKLHEQPSKEDSCEVRKIIRCEAMRNNVLRLLIIGES